LRSGILLASVMAVLLNLFFNRLRTAKKAGDESAEATKGRAAA